MGVRCRFRTDDYMCLDNNNHIKYYDLLLHRCSGLTLCLSGKEKFKKMEKKKKITQTVCCLQFTDISVGVCIVCAMKD